METASLAAPKRACVSLRNVCASSVGMMMSWLAVSGHEEAVCRGSCRIQGRHVVLHCACFISLGEGRSLHE